jgi:hypothetical protein
MNPSTAHINQEVFGNITTNIHDFNATVTYSNAQTGEAKQIAVSCNNHSGQFSVVLTQAGSYSFVAEYISMQSNTIQTCNLKSGKSQNHLFIIGQEILTTPGQGCLTENLLRKSIANNFSKRLWKLPTNGVLLDKKALTLFCLLMLLTPLLSFPLVEFSSANFQLYKSEPKVSVSSPIMNAIYTQSTVPLNVKVEVSSHLVTSWEEVTWMQYSLDGQPGVNLTIKNIVNNNSFGYYVSVARTITDLPKGVHSLSIYGQTNLAETRHSKGVPLSNFTVTNYFIVDSAIPMIHVLSPEPKTYDSTGMLLEFKSDIPFSWVGFSLDNSQVITSLATLSLNSLLDGPHSLRMYGNDSAGDLYTSQTVDFTVRDHDPPVIQIDAAAIASRTMIFQPDVFDWASIPLIIEINEPTPWIGYSLDDKANKTIYGNSTLISNLPFGSHKIIVYAKDNGGNTGTSELYTFNLTSQGISSATLSPIESKNNIQNIPLLIAIILTLTVALATLVLLFRKRKSAVKKL